MKLFMPGSTQVGKKQPDRWQPIQSPIRFGSDKNGKIPVDTFQHTLNTPMPPVIPPVPQAEQAPPDRDLIQAVKGNQSQAVRQHLEAGADPNARDRLFYTALHRAVDQGNPETIDLLLEAGADPNAKAPLFQALPVHKEPASDQAQHINQLGGDALTMSPILQDTPLDRALHHHKIAAIPPLLLAGAEFPKSQQPKIQEALKTIYATQNLPERLEQAVGELDGKTAKVLLRSGVESKMLPFLFGDLLEAAIDNAQAPKRDDATPESDAERQQRLHRHHNSLQMMRLLLPHVPDYSYLADVIARNRDVVVDRRHLLPLQPQPSDATPNS